MRRIGKVHPSPASASASASSSTSFASTTNNKDAQSVLKLLPTAILTIVSVLSLDEREVLAYMIARSIKSTNTINPSSYLQHKNSNKLASSSCITSTHKPPLFDCECFDCYTSYWYRWDSSPNRELIHQAIEAFEEHLYKRELPKKGKFKNKKKLQIECRKSGKLQETEAGLINLKPESSCCVKQTPSESETARFSQLQSVDEENVNVELLSGKVLIDEEVERRLLPETTAVVLQGGGGGNYNNHKGLARKVLPDVLGLFNSRLWNLWGPNV